MNISNDLNEFIKENIELIENHDINAIDWEAVSLNTEDKHIPYRILRAVENSYTWLQNTTEVPNNFLVMKK